MPPDASATVVEGIDVSFYDTDPGQAVQQHQQPPRLYGGSADGGAAEGGKVRDAEVSDLLFGYFEYCAEGFCHVTQVCAGA